MNQYLHIFGFLFDIFRIVFSFIVGRWIFGWILVFLVLDNLYTFHKKIGKITCLDLLTDSSEDDTSVSTPPSRVVHPIRWCSGKSIISAYEAAISSHLSSSSSLNQYSSFSSPSWFSIIIIYFDSLTHLFRTYSQLIQRLSRWSD